MAQLTAVLPNDHLLEGAQGGPRYFTTVYAGSTGVERRNVWWAIPRHHWSVQFGGLVEEIQPVIDLVEEAKGKGYSFLWTPPGYSEMSFRLDTDEPEVIYESGGIARISFSIIQVLGE